MDSQEIEALVKAKNLLKESLGKLEPKDADVLVAQAMGIIEAILITNRNEEPNQ